MLYLMRKHATSWIIKIILGAIVIVFMFWGVGSFKSQKENRVAEVDGVSISLEEYRNAYNNMLENYKRQFGQSLDDKLIERLNIKQQTVKALIERTLILKEANRLRFNVTDAELAGAIQKVSFFQQGGQFNNRRYHDILRRYYKMSPDQFEAAQRNSMLMTKIQAFVTNSAKVSENEARAWFTWNDERVGLDFVFFDPMSYTDVNITDEELPAFFDENKEDYKTEPEIRVNYLYFSAPSYISEVNISEEQIKDYYETHTDEFKDPKTVEASHILLKVDKDADDERVEKVHGRMAEIFKMASEGKDFAELAKEYSEGPSKNKGGYLGVFKEGDMVKPFSDKAFSMKAGEISEPVLTSFGWHIIKVENINEAKTQSFEEISAELGEKLKNKAALVRAYDDAEAVYDIIFEENDLASAAESRGLTLVKTDFFTQRGPVEAKKDKYKLASEAFKLHEKQISDIIDLKTGYYIIQAMEKREPVVPEFIIVQDRVSEDLKRKKQKELAHNDAEKFLNALKKDQNHTDARVQFESTELFKRTEEIPEIGYEQEISKAAFLLTQAKPLHEKVLEGRMGYYVIRLKERKKPDDIEFTKQRDEIKQKLLEQKKSKIFEDWIAGLRSGSEILIEDRFMD
ncbi:peptidyl-prolyl cis-trans isomerase D [Candidatus Magnetomoraceae bacterium gMMP-13]